MLIIFIVILFLVFGMHVRIMRWEFWESYQISQSKTLPYISGTFVGRETELNDVLQLLDFDQFNTRVVSIDGPPGFGKSTLAIKVGHRMVHKGINVLYVNMLEVFSMQVLDEKVCKGAGITAVRIKSMFQWARDLSYNTLLIFDNCDDILQTHPHDFQKILQTVVEMSPVIKVLMTSRHKVTLLDDSYRYTLHELSHHSACQLLEATIKGIKLDFNTRGVIANLTGNVPLALKIVGSLLNQPVPPSPETVIKELMQKPIQALSPEELPEHHQVYVSIYLSYKYLHQYDKLCGQFLAYFPGSFDQDAAFHIMQISPSQFFPTSYSVFCLRALVQRSLLMYNQRTEHFEFHMLIKEFFLFRSRLEGNSAGMQYTFNVSFQSHFAHQLFDLSSQFSHSQKFALGALDTEKHNIKYFLEGTTDYLEPTNSVKVISALLAGLEKNFLECRFNVEELHNVTKSATNFLQHHYEQMGLDASTHFVLFVNLVHHLAVFESEIEDSISSGLKILTSHEEHIKYLYTKAEKNSVATQYISFYSKLSNYFEELGLHDQVLRCQEKLLETTNSLKNCQSGSCNYFDIGVSYLKAGDNSQGVKYLELAVQQSQMEDELQRAHCLSWLHDGYTRTGETAKAEQVAEKLIVLLPAILKYDATMQNKYQFEKFIRFYIGVGKSQEAGVLQEKILQLLMESHETRDPRTAQYAKKLTVFLYSIRNYSKAAEIGHVTIERLKSCGLERDVETAEMFVLVGKSKLLTGDISGLSYFDDVINLMEESEYTSSEAQKIRGLACILRMWKMDINCIWIVSHFLLNALDENHEVSRNRIEKISHPKSTSTDLAVHSQNIFSVDFLSQIWPVSYLRACTDSYTLGLAYYILKFVVVPIIVIFLTCWPCLACGCMICISAVHCCCCCYCCTYHVHSCNWVGKCIFFAPLLIAIYYPAILIVYYIIIFPLSFCHFCIISCLIIRSYGAY